MPAQTSLDCVGPFAATLPTLISAMEAIDPSFRAAVIPPRIKVGMLEVQASEHVTEVVAAALHASGQHRLPVSLDHFEAAYTAGMAIINRETFAACGDLLSTGKVGADIAGRLEAAAQTTDEALSEAERIRVLFSAEVDAVLQRCDVLALPTMPDVPLRVEDATDTRAVLGMTSLVRPFNLSGHPAVTLPLFSSSGLPVGLQLVGAKGRDEALLAAASLLLQRIHDEANPPEARQ